MLDAADAYAFEAWSGAVLALRLRGTSTCPLLISPTGEHVFQLPCAIGDQHVPESVRLPERGRWTLVLQPAVAEPSSYRFDGATNATLDEEGVYLAFAANVAGESPYGGVWAIRQEYGRDGSCSSQAVLVFAVVVVAEEGEGTGTGTRLPCSGLP